MVHEVLSRSTTKGENFFFLQWIRISEILAWDSKQLFRIRDTSSKTI